MVTRRLQLTMTDRGETEWDRSQSSNGTSAFRESPCVRKVISCNSRGATVLPPGSRPGAQYQRMSTPPIRKETKPLLLEGSGTTTASIFPASKASLRFEAE